MKRFTKPVAWAFSILALLASEIALAQDVVATVETAELARADTELPPLDAYWLTVHPPLIYGLDRFGASNALWLRLHLDLARTPREAWTVYVRRQKQNITVFAGSNLLGTSADDDPHHTESWNYPQLIEIPAYLLHAGRNDIYLHWYASLDGDTSYLSAIKLGPASLLIPEYRRQHALQVAGPIVVSVVCGAVGLFMLALWLRQRGDDVFGWFGLVSLLWVVRNAQLWVREPPMSPRAWEVLSHASLGCLVAALFVFAFRLIDRRYRRLEVALALYPLLGSALLVAVPDSVFDVAERLYFLGLLPIAAVLIGYLCWIAWQIRTATIWLLMLGAIVCLGLGGFDFYALTVLFGKTQQLYLMPYGALLLTLTAGWAVIDRMVNYQRALETLNTGLEQRVAARERELAASYARAAELGRQAAISEERRRIMRDMHDGLGAQLMSSISLAECGNLSAAEVAQLLRECVDDLRLAIDSLKPLGDDLNAMLGNFRYRFENRLAAAGLNLEWAVQELPHDPALNPEAVLQIMRIVQEALTNVLKHARATRVRIAARFDASTHALTLDVGDNGCGFRRDSVRLGEGLRSMTARAMRIGARLDIAAENGTKVTLRLPLTASAAQNPA